MTRSIGALCAAWLGAALMLATPAAAAPQAKAASAGAAARGGTGMHFGTGARMRGNAGFHGRIGHHGLPPRMGMHSPLPGVFHDGAGRHWPAGRWAAGYPYDGYGLHAAASASDTVRSCMKRFRSYNLASRSYLGYDGKRRHCP